jgi:hypothetical protein
MPDTTHTLKFRADSRAVKVAGEEIKKAFDPRSGREFRREMTSLQRRLKDITSAQAGLVKELMRVEEGTDAYKKLQDQLKGVEDQAKTVRSAIQGITSAHKEFGSEQRRGFVAGAAQGLGIAQYIPSERGMGRRIAGAMVGRGVRGAGARATRAGTAPFTQPGLSGLTTAVGAIPWVGPMAAGQIQALSGMYQEALGFQRASRAALFAQGAAPTPEERRARIARAEEAVVQIRQAGALGAEAAGELAADVQAKQARAARPVVKRRQTAGGLPWYARSGRDFPKGSYAAEIAEEMEVTAEPAAEAEGAAEGGRRRIRSLVRPTGFRRDIGTVADVKEVRRQTEEAVKAVRARARAVPTGLPGAGAGAQFGIGGQEMMQQFGQFMQARGGTYDDVKRRQFVQQMAATTMGVSAGTAGQYARMGIAGGGGFGTADLATVLQSAVAMGLRGSQVPEYLQTLVGLGQQAERQGVRIDERGFGRQSALLRAVGFQGPQIGRVAAGMTSAAMDLSQRGVSSPVDMIMMRAAGYDPTQGIESYARASNRMAGGMDLDMLQNLMGMIVRGARGGIGRSGRETAVMMTRRFFGNIKNPIGPGQASTILDAYQQGKLGREHLSMLGKTIDQGERRGAHGRLVEEARTRVGRGAYLTQIEAGMEAKRIALGTKMSGTMVKLNEASLSAAGAVANFSGQLKTVAGWMADFTKKMEQVTKGNVWEKLKEQWGF